jgi:vesicle-fusing ATPase
MGARFSNAVLQTLMVLIGRRPPKGRRLLILATTSVRSILSDLGFSESFDSELRVPPITSLRALEYIVHEVELFERREDRKAAIRMLDEAGFGPGSSMDGLSSKLQIGVKRLLTVIEMARQEPDNAGQRLVSSLMGLGM